MKKFFAGKTGNTILGIVLSVIVFVLLGVIFGLGGAIGGAIAGGVGFGSAAAIGGILKKGDAEVCDAETKDNTDEHEV